MPLLQPILDIAEILSRKGVTRAVISPGSRNAHLTIALARHQQIQTYSISDERSAAFVAMGMAQTLKQPVAIVCTSGSAAYNYAPAVAEAFFQQIPLVVLTADRPKEWIHQHDGQTIYQTDIFGKHVKQSFELGSDYTHPDSVWHIERTMNHALNLAQTLPMGPVHVNIPIREPFYPSENEKVIYQNPRIIERTAIEQRLSEQTWQVLMDKLLSFDRILIAGGQDDRNDDLNDILQKLQDEFFIPVLGDTISNLGNGKISKQDIFLKNTDQDLQPELLLTFGKSFISKNFKTFLRQNKPIEHWHITHDEHLIDTFQALTKILPVSPLYFFKKLFEDLDFQKFRSADEDFWENDYLSLWQKKNNSATLHSEKYKWGDFSEFEGIQTVLQALPPHTHLHLANSMAVRYVNHLGVDFREVAQVYANRGTSGIDGSLSTAVGCAMATNEPVYLLTGDVAFFYDRNGLWNRYLPHNLRVVLLNNHGGGIFRMIDGPNKQPELEDYFETQQNLTAQKTAEDAQMDYFLVNNREQFTQVLTQFVSTEGRAKLLEIETSAETNTLIFKEFKAKY
jgi:2-succinyl-5-enolpyruvyl-6-hydroxy-3-cyclohexene-1-carboxylate synthase